MLRFAAGIYENSIVHRTLPKTMTPQKPSRKNTIRNCHRTTLLRPFGAKRRRSNNFAIMRRQN